MANHCWNSIVITGETSTIKNLFDELTQNQNGFEMYQKLKDIYSGGEIGDDAKWFDMFVTLDNENEISITGDSAWGPCLDLFVEISKKYSSVDIEYYYEEQGFDFIGNAYIKDGYIKDECYSYWEGMIQFNGESDALEMFINNELDLFCSLEDLRMSVALKFFSQESIKAIEEQFNELKSINDNE